MERLFMSVPLSIIVPAYNEEQCLPDTLQVLKQGMKDVSQRIELIVVDNNSDDRTAEIARTEGATVVFEPENQIARARNAGAREARGEWYLFVDADTLVPPELLSNILDQTEKPDVMGGGARLKFLDGAPRQARWGISVWNWISDTLHWAAGSVFWCRADLFEQVGGFNEAVYASEEIWLSRALKKAGKKNSLKFHVINHPRARTSARKFEEFSTFQLTAGFLMFLLAPWVIFSKRACRWYWYD